MHASLRPLLFGWLVGWFGWLVGWFGRLVGWLVGWLESIYCSVGAGSVNIMLVKLGLGCCLQKRRSETDSSIQQIKFGHEPLEGLHAQTDCRLTVIRNVTLTLA